MYESVKPAALSAAPSLTGDVLAIGVPVGDVDLPGLSEALEVIRPSAEAGSTAKVHLGEVVVHLVGTGDGSPEEIRKAGGALARAARGATRVVVDLGGELRAAAEGVVLGGFDMSWKSGKEPVGEFAFVGADADELAEIEVVTHAAFQARLLANIPANAMSPQGLVDRVLEYARRTPSLTAKVWDEADLAEGGFGGILAVGAASATPPRMLQLSWAPEGATRHVVLVGKGITYDTGGLSIKPAGSMVTMKRDMTGAAVVASAITAIAELNLPVRVTALLAIAENAVGPNATRPGDVITHWGGRTSEVNNTDAEGRLVLADAMQYAVTELQPDVLIDVATLTGAMKAALGTRIAGFFATSDDLAADLTEAGETAGEPVWRMPLVEGYNSKLDSPVADANNAPGAPGAITAALFLKPFAGDVPWVHLDIAGVGDADADEGPWTKGATGFGVRLLVDLLR